MSSQEIGTMSREELLRHKLKTCSENSFGENVEKIWANVFRRNGIGYIPLSKIDVGKAPVLEDEGKLILPDFEVSTSHRRIRAYVESKGKRGPVLFQKAGQWRHGIDGYHWENYLAIAARNVQKACLAVLELFTDAHAKSVWSGSLLIQTLQTLGEPIRGFSNQRHMVYFPRSSFVEICRIPTALELATLIGSWKSAPECKDALMDVLGRDEPIQGQFFV